PSFLVVILGRGHRPFAGAGPKSLVRIGQVHELLDGRGPVLKVDPKNGAFERDSHRGRFDPAPGLDPKGDMRLARQRVDRQPVERKLACLDTETLGYTLVEVREKEWCYLRHATAVARRIGPEGSPLAVADEERPVRREGKGTGRQRSAFF